MSSEYLEVLDAELGEAVTRLREVVKDEDLIALIDKLEEAAAEAKKAIVEATPIDPTHGGCVECIHLTDEMVDVFNKAERLHQHTTAAGEMADLLIHWAKVHAEGPMISNFSGFDLRKATEDEIREYALAQATYTDGEERRYEQFKVASEALEHAIDVYEADKTEENFEAMCRASDEYGAAITPSSAALERNIGEF